MWTKHWHRKTKNSVTKQVKCSRYVRTYVRKCLECPQMLRVYLVVSKQYYLHTSCSFSSQGIPAVDPNNFMNLIITEQSHSRNEQIKLRYFSHKGLSQFHIDIYYTKLRAYKRKFKLIKTLWSTCLTFVHCCNILLNQVHTYVLYVHLYTHVL